MASLVLLLTAAWAALALYYQLPLPTSPRVTACGMWGLLSITALCLLWRGRARLALVAYGAAFALLLGWWSQIAPSDTRDWADDVARHLHARVDGTQVTLDNVRDFDWRSDTDYSVRWQTRHYDLDRLRSADLAMSYWMGPAIAHTLVSFGFANDHGGHDYLSFSIEIRKERGESFSAVAGFFKRYELSLVAADERDVLRVRTNVRGEDVYLYRLAMPPEAMRSLFLAYLAQAHDLAQQPRFYNTLTANCTTLIFQMAQHIVGGLPLDWRLLASGYLPGYLQRVGGLAAAGALADITAQGRITDRARAAGDDPDFSMAIRRGMPGASEAAP